MKTNNSTANTAWTVGTRVQVGCSLGAIICERVAGQTYDVRMDDGRVHEAVPAEWIDAAEKEN